MSNSSSVNEAVSRGAQGYSANNNLTREAESTQSSSAFNRKTTFGKEDQTQVRDNTGALGGKDAEKKSFGDRRLSLSHPFVADKSQHAETSEIPKPDHSKSSADEIDEIEKCMK